MSLMQLAMKSFPRHVRICKSTLSILKILTIFGSIRVTRLSGRDPDIFLNIGSSCIFQRLLATASKAVKNQDSNVVSFSSNMFADLANANSMMTSFVRHLKVSEYYLKCNKTPVAHRKASHKLIL